MLRDSQALAWQEIRFRPDIEPWRYQDINQAEAAHILPKGSNYEQDLQIAEDLVKRIKQIGHIIGLQMIYDSIEMLTLQIDYHHTIALQTILIKLIKKINYKVPEY